MGWFVNTFETIFSQKILWMDFHNCFNFALILHKVTFHIKLRMSLGSPPFSHDQAFRWSLSLNCHGGNIVLTHKLGFMLSILRCLCNTFIPTQNWSSNQRWMWSNNPWYEVHLELSPQLGWSLIGCGKHLQFDVKRGYIISKTLCNRWGHDIIYPFCLCILWFWIILLL